MAKEKQSFVIHYSKAKQMLDFLDLDEIGRVFTAIVNYEIDGEETDFDDRTLKVIYEGIKFDLDSNRKKYQATCQKREEAINKRWEEKKKQEGGPYVEAPPEVKALINRALG